ncbi:cadherin-like domain-containing protein [bacterium]|nr:cadherin-like domain-containing protein [bacterium]
MRRLDSVLVLVLACSSVASYCRAARGYPELQLGLGGIARYGQARFANALYTAGEWVTNASGGWTWQNVQAPQLDRNGNPLYVLPNIPLVALPLYDASTTERTNMCKGRLSLTWEGEADIRLPNATHVSGTVSGVVLNGRRDYTSSDGGGNRMMMYLYALNTNNPPRNIRLWLPDPADAMNRSLAPPAGQAGPLFHPTYLDVVRPFRLFRFMDWLETNNNRTEDWSDRRPPAHCFMHGQHIPGKEPTGGVAYELCIALCNTAGADMWICVPHLATDEYVTNLARLVLYGSDGTNGYTAPVADPVYRPLDTNLRVFVEYSNEVWNPGFTQGNWAYNQSVALGLTWGQFVGRKASRVWNIFNAVWGAANTQRIVRVGAGRSGDAGYCRSFINEAIANGVKPHFVSIAPYFGNDIEDWVYAKGAAFFTDRSSANINCAHDELQRRLLSGVAGSSVMNDDTGGGINQAIRDVCVEYNLPLVNYEGGPSIYTSDIDTPSNQPTGSWLTSFMTEFNRDPRMVETYNINMNLCKLRGLTTHAMFVDISGWGKYGQWGHKEFTAQSTNYYTRDCAVKYKYMIDWMAGQASIRHIDEPLGSVPTFDNDYNLPPAEIGRPYKVDLTTSGGNGARTAKLIGAYLAGGISVTSVPGAADMLRIAGAATNTVAGGQCAVFARVLDADGDPGWGRFVFKLIGGNGTIVESDFTGASPALNRPWTNCYYLAPEFACAGWDRGAGVTTYAGSNAFIFALNMPSTESAATLALAIADNEYLTVSVTPPPGTTVDLRNAEVQFSIGRIDYHAPRRFAVFTSVGGFTDGAQVYDTGRFTSMLPEAFSFRMPGTAAYQSLTGAIEFRIYGYAGQYAGHKASLSAFKLTATNVTFNQRPIAVDDDAAAQAQQAVNIDVLANDMDWDGNALAVQSVSGPVHGSAVVMSNAVQYTAPALMSVTDTFTYVMNDGRGATDSATVSVIVVPEPAVALAVALSLSCMAMRRHTLM